MMKKMIIKNPLLLIPLFVVLLTALVSCEHIEEEVEINLGYKKDVRVPDAEPMTAEDSAFVAAQHAEYEQNAK